MHSPLFVGCHVKLMPHFPAVQFNSLPGCCASVRRDEFLPGRCARRLFTAQISSAHHVSGSRAASSDRTGQRNMRTSDVSACALRSAGISSSAQGKGTWYSAAARWTHAQERFTISEVAADWHELMIPQRIMRPSVARASEQLDPKCSMQTYHHPNHLH